MRTFNVLILGGSTEGFGLAERICNRPGIRLTTSFAGRTDRRRNPAGRMRSGGFGGIDGLVAFLKAESIDAVIDATHPFARQMSRHAREATRILHIACLHVVRSAWIAEPEDHWTDVDTPADAASQLRPGEDPVFVTTGRQQLAPFLARKDLRLVVRTVDPLGSELTSSHPRLDVIADRGPFRYERERELMSRYHIRTLVAKNSGGKAAWPKMKIARELNLRVLLVRRPEIALEPVVSTVSEAVRWLNGIPGAPAGEVII